MKTDETFQFTTTYFGELFDNVIEIARMQLGHIYGGS